MNQMFARTRRALYWALKNYHLLAAAGELRSSWPAPTSRRTGWGGAGWETAICRKADADCALAALPARQRYVIIECIVAGRQQAEVGQELGVSRGTVAQLIARGLDKAARFLGLDW